MTKLTIIKNKLAFTRNGSTMMFPFTWIQNDNDGQVTINDVSSERSFTVDLADFVDSGGVPIDAITLLDLLASYCYTENTSTIEVTTTSPLDVTLTNEPLQVLPASNNWQNLINTFNGTADLNPLGASTILVQIVGTFVMTLSFEVSQNGSNWLPALGIPSSGVNQVQVSSVTTQNAWLVDVAGWSYFRVRCTSYTSGGANVLLNASNSATINRSVSSGQATQPVSGTVTANIGTGSIGAGTNLAMDVGLQVRANATGAASGTVLNCPATPVGQSIKATAGRILGLYVNNSNASLRWLKIFNTASVTMGTTSAVLDIPIPPSNNTQWIDLTAFGISASTAIVVAITGAKGLTNNTGVTLDDVAGFIVWA